MRYIIATLLTGFLSGCTSTDSPTLVIPRPSVETGSSSPNSAVEIRPMRTDWVPGLVFLGTVNGEELIIDDILCANVYTGIKPESSELGYLSRNENENINLDLSITPLNTVAKQNGLKISLPNFTKETGYKFEPGKVIEFYYPRSVQWEKGVAVKIDDDCQRAIDSAKEDGTFKDQVWIVPGSMAFESPKYTFSKTTSLTTNIQLEYTSLVNAAINSGYTSSSSGGLTSISEGKLLYFRSAKPRLIREWIKSGAVGATRTATVTTSDNEPFISKISTKN